MRQRFIDKFEIDEWTGNRLYLTTACFDRHYIDREEMKLTDKENKIRNLECMNRADREENICQNYLAQGYRPLKNESIEEFITRCKEDICL